jgi:hypothetical protein
MTVPLLPLMLNFVDVRLRVRASTFRYGPEPVST